MSIVHSIKIGTGSKILLLVLFLSVVLLTILIAGQKTFATYNNGANLIDNLVYRDTSTMSRSQIQSFLAGKNSGLTDMSFTFDCYGQDSKEREWYTAIGAPCDQQASAADIIYYASRIYGINPQVVLATLQKEQSLVTNPNPSSHNLHNAMGYGCPTSGSCQSTGFFRQVDFGTWALRFHYERAGGNMSWWSQANSWTCGNKSNDNDYTYYRPGLVPGQTVTFYDGDGYNSGGTGYRTYKIANAATAALYCYTPHAFNNPNGLHGLPQYGSTGEYFSGSYWFVVRFTQWFGSPFGEANAVYRLFKSNTNNHLYTASRAERDKAVKDHGFRYEGVALRSCPSGGQVIYRLYNPSTGRHLFTASASERDKARAQTNFGYEGIAFRVCGDRAVYRLYSAREQKHFYTTSKSERDKLTRQTSFVYEGVAFRVQ